MKLAKQIILFLSAVIFTMGVYMLNDYRLHQAQQQIAQTRQVANNLAVSLSQVNKLFPEGNQYVERINVVLKNNGYAQLIRVKPDSTK